MWSKEKETLDEFVDKLPTEALIHLLGGQPNTGVANTFGMGNLPEYGIPNIMTADGPAGLRIQPQCGVNTTAWPCATLLACTWDPELIEEIGKSRRRGSQRKQYRHLADPRLSTFTEARSAEETSSIIPRIRLWPENPVRQWYAVCSPSISGQV